jgi:DNA-binding XRE family transcriptional regulator
LEKHLMKNWDLKWAREWAGLSQVEAAAKMGVNKQTWNRWERGTHPTPKGALRRMIELTAMPPEVERARLRYDDEGYPRGFSRKQFEAVTEAAGIAAEARGEKWPDQHAVEDAALEELEGDEHEGRARERYRLLMVRRLGMSDADVARDLALYDGETERLKKYQAETPADCSDLV